MKYVSHDKHGCATLSEQTKCISYTDIKYMNVKSMKFTLVPILISQINILMVDLILALTQWHKVKFTFQLIFDKHCRFRTE